MDNHIKNMTFGPYGASYTTKKDVAEVIALLNKAPSAEKDSIDRYTESVLEESISAGFFTKISRLPANKAEYNALGEPEKLVALAGAARLDIDYRIPTELNQGRDRVCSYPMDINCLFYDRSGDLPNAFNELPRGCFFKFLVSATTLNLFRLAGEIVGGRLVNFDTLECHHENSEETAPIMKRLTDRPVLGWDVVERPSKHLAVAVARTIVNSSEFMKRDNMYYELNPSKLPNNAKYLLDCWDNSALRNDSVSSPNCVDIDVRFSNEMLVFLNSVKNTSFIDSKNEPLGYREIRRRIDFDLDTPDGEFSRERKRTIPFYRPEPI
ncbi:MAG: hypothetical protein PHW76_04215 [Alphaproteobacteria bacterium]|nr:hypothetical protein [Alphaproteobacteria bacterium]